MLSLDNIDLDNDKDMLEDEISELKELANMKGYKASVRNDNTVTIWTKPTYQRRRKVVDFREYESSGMHYTLKQSIEFAKKWLRRH